MTKQLDDYIKSALRAAHHQTSVVPLPRPRRTQDLGFPNLDSDLARIAAEGTLGSPQDRGPVHPAGDDRSVAAQQPPFQSLLGMSPEGIGWENWRNSDNVEDSRTLADIARQNDATQSLDISKAVRPELEGYDEGGGVNPRFTMTNSGKPFTGESVLDNSQWGPYGYRDNYLGKDVPAYGGGLTLPGGIDINANYQTHPNSYHAPDKFGVMARKTWGFADGGEVEQAGETCPCCGQPIPVTN